MRSAISRRSAGRSTGSATSRITCPAGSTRLTNGAAGVLFYNNTILSETHAAGTSNTHWRNNLMLGENAAPAIFSVTTYTGYTSSDYNGFRPNPGAAASFHWNAPPRGVAGGLPGPVRGATLEARQFATLAEYAPRRDKTATACSSTTTSS